MEPVEDRGFKVTIAFLSTFGNPTKKYDKYTQGVIQRKIADGGNRPAVYAADQFLKKPLWGVSRLAKTASSNIFPRGEFFHETQINFHQNLILIG